MKCMNCGKEITIAGQFCPHCGSQTADNAMHQNLNNHAGVQNPSSASNQQKWQAAYNPQPRLEQQVHHVALGKEFFFSGLVYPFKAYGFLGLIKAYILLLIPLINYRVTGFALSTMGHVGNGYGDTLHWKQADKKLFRGLSIFLISLLYSLPAAAWILFVERKAYIGAITSNGLFRSLIFLGYLVFGIIIYHFPMGIAHYAVTGKFRSAFNLKYINQLIRNRKMPYLITVIASMGLYMGILMIGYIFQNVYFIVVPILVLFYTATWSYWFGHHYFYARWALPTELGGRGLAIHAMSVLPWVLAMVLFASSALTSLSYAVNMSELTGEPQVELGIEEKNRQEKMDVIIKYSKGEATKAELNDAFDDNARRVKESGSGNSNFDPKDVENAVFIVDKIANYIPGVNTFVGITKTFIHGVKTVDSARKITVNDILNFPSQMDNNNNRVTETFGNLGNGLWEAAKTFGNSFIPGAGNGIDTLAKAEDVRDVLNQFGNGSVKRTDQNQILNPYNSPIFMKHYLQANPGNNSNPNGLDNMNPYNSDVFHNAINGNQEGSVNYDAGGQDKKPPTQQTNNQPQAESVAETPEVVVRLIPQGEEYMIFDNFNIDQVGNKGKSPSLDLQEPHQISKIMTYHWNGQKGSGLASIGLIKSDGTEYGPWEAIGIDGQGGVPNAYMVVTPGIELPKGKYLIYTTQMNTWSTNSGAGGIGMTQVTGTRLKEVEVDLNAPPETPIQEKFFTIKIVNDSLSTQIFYVGHNSVSAKEVASGGSATFEVGLRCREADDGRIYFEDKILLNANNGTSVISNKLQLTGYLNLTFKFTDLDFQLMSP